MDLFTLTFVISSISSGGAERILSIIANYWAHKGRNITILTLDDGKEAPFFSLHPSITHRSLGLVSIPSNPIQGIMKNVKRIFVIRRAIKESCPQLVISFIDQTNILTLLATIGLRLPVVVAERTDPYSHSIGRVWGLLRICIYPRTRCLVVQSRRAFEYFPAFIKRRTKIIPNPVICPKKERDCIENDPPCRFVAPQEIEIEIPYGPPLKNGETKRGFWNNQDDNGNKKRKVIIGIGRLSQEKGFDLLLHAFGKISERYPEWSLTIFGEGPLRFSLESLSDQLGLSGKAHFPGRTKAPVEALEKADIFVLSSRYEGFPNALCEAMACGLAVVSFDCPSGPGEIILNRVNGILVQPGDITALAAAIESLIQNEKERIRLGQRAREIIDRFGIEKVMAQWEDVLARV